MKNDETVLVFGKILKFRTLFKRISQVSWNINELEKRFDVSQLTPEQAKQLLEAYKEQANWIAQVGIELKEALTGKYED